MRISLIMAITMIKTMLSNLHSQVSIYIIDKNPHIASILVQSKKELLPAPFLLYPYPKNVPLHTFDFISIISEILPIFMLRS